MTDENYRRLMHDAAAARWKAHHARWAGREVETFELWRGVTSCFSEPGRAICWWRPGGYSVESLRVRIVQVTPDAELGVLSGTYHSCWRVVLCETPPLLPPAPRPLWIIPVMLFNDSQGIHEYWRTEYSGVPAPSPDAAQARRQTWCPLP